MSSKVILACEVKAQQFEALLPFLEKNLPNTRSFPGCLHVSIFFNDTTGQMIIDEEWLSPAHHQKYIEFIASNGVMAKLVDFLIAPPQVSYFERIMI